MSGFNRNRLENNAEKENLKASRLWKIADSEKYNPADMESIHTFALSSAIQFLLPCSKTLRGMSHSGGDMNNLQEFTKEMSLTTTKDQNAIESDLKNYSTLYCIMKGTEPETLLSTYDKDQSPADMMHKQKIYEEFLQKLNHPDKVTKDTSMGDLADLREDFMDSVREESFKALPGFADKVKKSVTDAMQKNNPEKAIALLHILSGPVSLLSADPAYRDNESVKQLSAMTAACDRFISSAEEIRNDPECNVRVAEKIMLESMETLEQAAGMKEQTPAEQRYLNDPEALSGSFESLYKTLDANHRKNWRGKERSGKYQNVMGTLMRAITAEQNGESADYEALSRACRTYLDNHTPSDKLGEKRYETVQRVMNITAAKQKALQHPQEKPAAPAGKDSAEGWTVVKYSDLSGMAAEKRAAEARRAAQKAEVKRQKALKSLAREEKQLFGKSSDKHYTSMSMGISEHD